MKATDDQHTGQPLVVVPLRRDLAYALVKYIAEFKDPIWFGPSDLINDLIERFLFEQGRLPIKETTIEKS